MAGILEEADHGLLGIKRRAVEEAWEEAGVRLRESDIEFLGQKIFPTPGMAPKRSSWSTRKSSRSRAPPTGDGSPMEHGAKLRWLPLDDALRLCEQGEVEDAKTEILLHRLRRTLLG